MPNRQVCLFFYVNGEFLIHGCSPDEAEHYGDFLVYPESHMDEWDKHNAKTYGVDYDFFPRGRVAYHKAEGVFQILYDPCIGDNIRTLVDDHYSGAKVTLGNDEHYQCHKCNRNYIL